MTTHDIPNRRRRAAFVVGASVAIGLATSVGLQIMAADPASDVAAASAHDCATPALVAL